MERKLIRDRGGPFDLSGFEDAKTGENVIPRRFDRVFDFSEGLAAVREKGLWGYIDGSGEMIIAPQFDLAGGFHNGSAQILVKDRIGLIDRTGRIIVDPQFSAVEPFTASVVLAREGTWRSKYYLGHEQLENELPKPTRLYRIGCGWITDDAIEVEIFDPAQELVWAKPKGGENWGLMRLDGAWLMEPRFDGVEPLKHGLARVHNRIKAPGQRDVYLTGAVDATGKLVVPLKPWRILKDDRFYFVHDEGRCGVFHHTGRWLGGRMFDEIKITDMLKARIGQEWSFLLDDETLLPEKEFFRDTPVCEGRLTIRRRADGYQIIGPDGAPTTPEVFSYLDAARFRCDGPNIVGVGQASPEERWGLVDGAGRLMGPGLAFEGMTDFVSDQALVWRKHALVWRKRKWGLIDSAARIVLEPIYDSLMPAGGGRRSNGARVDVPMGRPGNADVWGLLVAKKDDRFFALDINGVEQPLPREFDPTLPPLPKTRLTMAGALRFETENGLWGIVDANDAWIIPAKYRALSPFDQGVAWAPIDEERCWRPIGPDGVVRDRPAGVVERYYWGATHHYPERLSDDRYENSVLWSRAYLEHLAGLREEEPKLIGDGVRA
jgi:hypothetical protein